ncbi:MAG: threonine--tRNA ligase [Spirochaetia bacterium]|nr:threonine--tRNA ligase [Spirochaetia bacterium]
MKNIDSNSISNSTDEQQFPLSTMRHSAAHVLAQAVLKLHPQADLAIGPDIENGFYYDILVDPPMREEDLPKIEKIMKELVKNKQKFEHYTLPSVSALEKLIENNQKFKHEMATELIKNGESVISFYRNVPKNNQKVLFDDMCAGPHVNHTGQIGHFKLTGISGAYWRGDSKNQQLQRIYGVLFKTKEELTSYLYMMEEAKKRDHRKLGTELELYTTSEKIGSGLILWLPRGFIIKDSLETWAKETEDQQGYQRVTTPMITKEDLFYTSEHLPHYNEHMFPPMPLDNENYYLKPMNCPFHHTIFGIRPRSYRELPLRLAEYGTCHRFEDSGALFGLMRVRAMSMNDAHIYCSKEQAVDEFVAVMKLHEYYYKALGITDYYMELALRNPENTKYHGDESMWKEAEDLTRKAMEVSGIEYRVEHDGAAFYGPKVDFQIKSSIGREFTASTCQLDLFMPEKFDLKYIDSDGNTKRPVCIHRSPLGTHERFVGFLIEHFAGAFPLWLAPEQIRIIPVGEAFHDYAVTLHGKFNESGFRVQLDETGETLGKKIRNAEKMKIPYMIVVGEKEKESGKVNVRNYFTGEQKELEVPEFISTLKKEVETKEIQRIKKADR